ncbi:cupin domain-containing protein [Sphingomonas sp. ASY06-1R]|uniref:cupin domain-containing protein n=1 Tax=Sphingomonas sp. ASY06-1R TaxID=3445771 RepID=UPI003FA2B67D
MMFRFLAPLLLVASTAAAAAPAAPHAVVVDLMNKALADYPGKEAVMISVTYPPGAVDPIHRHDAHAFLYVLEGSIMMGVRGGKTVTLKPGQTFYEGPHDVHTIGRNASATKPAKFLVVLLKKRGDPILTLAK